MDIGTPQGPCYSFEMVMEDDWRAHADRLIEGVPGGWWPIP